MITYDCLRVVTDAGVATVSLHRPERANAMTARMGRELAELLDHLTADLTTRVIVLTGTGSSFCPGGDLEELSRRGGSPTESLRPAGGQADLARRGGSNTKPTRFGRAFEVPALLHGHRAVVIAAVNGPCAGAGLGWAAACDLRYGSDTARFNTAFLDLAVSGDMGGPWTLSRLVGPSRARELYFRPGPFDAGQALALGLLDAVVPAADLAGHVDAIARTIAAHPPEILEAMKANFLDAERLDFGDYLHEETGRIVAQLRSPEALLRFGAAADRIAGADRW